MYSLILYQELIDIPRLNGMGMENFERVWPKKTSGLASLLAVGGIVNPPRVSKERAWKPST
jgi:hypothetical protein